MKRLVFLFALLLMAGLIPSGLHAQGIPAWAKDLPNLPVKPEYYQGLGGVRTTEDVEADWQKASGQARGQISAQIRVRVVSTVATKIEEVSRGTEQSLTDAFSSTTDQIAEGTLEGVVLERWFDEDTKTLYAYGAVSRAEVERRFNEKLQGAVNSAKVYYDAARQASGNADIYLACTQYLEAAKVVSLAEIYLNKTVTGDLNGAGNKPVLPLLQSEMCGLLGKLRFQITGGNDQQGERGKALPMPLGGKLLVETSSGKVAVKNALLTAAFVNPAKGEVAAEARSDESGYFTFAVGEIKGGEAVNKIRVGLSLSGLAALKEKLPEVGKCWTNAYIDFAYRLRSRTNVNIAIHILESNLDKPRSKSSVQDEIQKRLLGDRYTIVEESKMFRSVSEEKINGAIRSGNYDVVTDALSKVADVVIIGHVATKERNNPMSQIYFSTGSASIRVIDVKSGQVIASVGVDNEKEGGGSYDVAGLKLLQRLGKKIGEDVKTELDKGLQ